jgi:hypothetical protein
VVVDPSCLVPLTMTFVIPIGKNDPERGSLATTPQLPVKVGVGKLTMAPFKTGSLFTIIFGILFKAHAEMVQGDSERLKFNCHPPLIFPTLPPISSIAYRLHVPLGFVPLKIESSCGSG